MAGPSTVGYTPGTGANIVIYADASSNDHPVGLLEFLVGSTPTVVSASAPLPITITDASLVVNAGTDLNTSALALETGGNLDTIAGKDFATQATLSALNAKINACDTGAVVIASGSITVSNFPGSQAVTGTFWQATQPVSLASVPTHAVTQSGTWTVTGAAGTFPITDSGGSLTVDAPVGTPAFVRLSDGTTAITTLPVSLASVPSHAVTNAGTFAVQAAQTGTWNVATVTAVTAITNALPAGTNTIGATTTAASTTGGATPYQYISAGSANQDSQSVKGSAGTVYAIEIANTIGSARFVKLYDKATAPTSADTPVKTLLAPPGGGSNVVLPVGIAFATGIGIRITTGVAVADTGAAGSGDVAVNLDYK